MSLNDDWAFYSRLSWEDQVLDNITMLLRDDLLKRGAYYNVTIDHYGITNTNESVLRAIPDINNNSSYKFYAGVKPDWVWETGVTRYEPSVGSDPISISGILINGTFVPTGTTFQGTGYHIDYTRGGVQFDNHVAPSSIIKCPYTYRWVSVYETDSDEYRQVIPDWYISSSGLYNSSYKPAAFLPAIFVDIRDMKTIRGTELGNSGRLISHELAFDIITNNAEERRKLQDVIFFLGSRSVRLFDADAIPQPLNYNGSLSSGYYNYSELLVNYPLNKWARFNDRVQITKVNNFNLPLHRSIVRVSLETDVFK